MSFFLKIALFLWLCGCGEERSAVPHAEETAVPVTVLTVEAKDVPVNFEYVAQTQSAHLVNIQARVNGFLEKRIYKEGQLVKRGDVLFLMDEKPFQAQVNAFQAALERQEAALENARLNLGRVKPLRELNALSQKDLDDANSAFQTNSAAVQQAKAQLEEALLNLSYCTIVSPLDGITSAALKQEGSYLNFADSQLTTVSAITPIWVNFSLSEYELQHFRDQVKRGELIFPKDHEFVVRIIQVNGELFPYAGKITFTEPYFNPQTGTFLIRASFKNPDAALWPNQYVRARVEGAIRPHAILVPQRAVLQSAKGMFVWVVGKDNRVEPRPVTVGEWQGDNWLIKEGLLSGEQIVVDGTLGLRQGHRVASTPFDQGKGK
jgi:membrane fusion protein (multidrug efflux system)